MFGHISLNWITFLDSQIPVGNLVSSMFLDITFKNNAEETSIIFKSYIEMWIIHTLEMWFSLKM